MVLIQKDVDLKLLDEVAYVLWEKMTCHGEAETSNEYDSRQASWQSLSDQDWGWEYPQPVMYKGKDYYRSLARVAILRTQLYVNTKVSA